jgi:hypothetical protein
MPFLIGLFSLHLLFFGNLTSLLQFHLGFDVGLVARNRWLVQKVVEAGSCWRVLNDGREKAFSCVHCCGPVVAQRVVLWDLQGLNGLLTRK